MQTKSQIQAFIKTCGVEVRRDVVEVFGMYGICARFDKITGECLYSNLIPNHPAIAAMKDRASVQFDFGRGV